jgi:hypothetical protein
MRTLRQPQDIIFESRGVAPASQVLLPKICKASSLVLNGKPRAFMSCREAFGAVALRQ